MKRFVFEFSRSFLAILCLLASACNVNRQNELSIVQICSVTPSDRAKLAGIFKTFGSEHGLRFIDNTAYERDLLIAGDVEDLMPSDQSLHLSWHLEGSDGAGLSAGILGLPSDQIAIGFSFGDNQSVSRQEFEELIFELSKHWTVHRLPPDVGANKIDNCHAGALGD